VQLQKKQHVHEKEMQQLKLQLENQLLQDVNVVQLQRKVQLEEKLQQDVVHPQGKAQLENQHEELELKEELHEELQEEDNNIFLFYFLKLCLIEC